jgi:hypothetical protein
MTGSKIDDRSSSMTKHLWWTVPVATVLGLPLWAWAGLSWCGISGCTGGGFGVDSRYVGTALACTISAGVLMFVAIAAVPWFRPVVGRLLIALGIGAAYAILGALITHSH